MENWHVVVSCMLVHVIYGWCSPLTAYGQLVAGLCLPNPDTENMGAVRFYVVTILAFLLVLCFPRIASSARSLFLVGDWLAHHRWRLATGGLGASLSQALVAISPRGMGRMPRAYVMLWRISLLL